jgi:hypothetical protein
MKIINVMKKISLFVVMLCYAVVSMAQSQSSLAYLESAYPQLTELFRKELSKYPAHYIFAVDVSGTMDKYSQFVSTALTPFFQALPNNDRVDVIPFGTDAKINMLNYCGVINPQVRTALCNNIKGLYKDPSYPKGFKGYTDVPKAVDAIAKVIQNNREYKVNVIVILTDFRNDEKGDSPSEHKISKQDLEYMSTAIAAATNGVYTRTVALELPVDKNKPGYCLDQLQNKVFTEETGGLEIVPLTNPGAMIGQWFEQLRRDIMTTKLKAVVDNANRTNPITLKSETDIDGNVLAEVHWTPSKLYPAMQIDSTFMSGTDFYFDNNEENYVKTLDSVIVVELGQIKHKEYGFHHLNDTINLGIKLPTPYDQELFSLGVKKPLPNTQKAEDRWIFTFFLSFATTLTIIILIILYIIGVIKAMIRNKNLCFKGNVTFYDEYGNTLGDTVKLPKQNSSAVLLFGSGGSPKCKVDGAEWQFEIKKKNANPFLVFAKPYFVWRATKKYVAAGKANSGRLSYENQTSIRVKCGLSRSEQTHSVYVKLMK